MWGHTLYWDCDGIFSHQWHSFCRLRIAVLHVTLEFSYQGSFVVEWGGEAGATLALWGLLIMGLDWTLEQLCSWQSALPAPALHCPCRHSYQLEEHLASLVKSWFPNPPAWCGRSRMSLPSCVPKYSLNMGRGLGANVRKNMSSFCSASMALSSSGVCGSAA